MKKTTKPAENKREIKGFVPSSPAAKSVSKNVPRTEEKHFTEMVIKEIMFQKNVSRDEALQILKERHS